MPRTTSENREPTSLMERIRNSRIKAYIAVAAGSTALTGCATGPEVVTEDTRPGTSAEAPAHEAPEVSTPAPEVEVSFEDQVAAIEIEAGLSPELLGEAFLDRYTEWANASATGASEAKQNEIIQGYLDYDGNREEYSDKLAKENVAPFSTALYIDGWESKDSLVQYVSGGEQYNSDVIEMYLATARRDGHTGPYRVEFNMEEVQTISSDDDSRTIALDWILTKVNGLNGNDPELGTYTITFEEVGGTEKISDIEVRSR